MYLYMYTEVALKVTIRSFNPPPDKKMCIGNIRVHRTVLRKSNRNCVFYLKRFPSSK